MPRRTFDPQGWVCLSALALLPLALLACGRSRAPSDLRPFDPYESADGACATAEEEAALALLNEARARAGAPLARCLPALHEVAAGHDAYLRRNRAALGPDWHVQRRHAPGFTGETLADRADAAGLDRRHFWISEGVGGGDGPEATLRLHLDAVYHRGHLLSPTTRYFAFSGRVLNTLIHTDTEGVEPLVHPADGAKDVPLSFDSDLEIPDPAPRLGRVGYPISVHLPRRIGEDVVEVEAFHVARDGEALVGRVLTKSTDPDVFNSDAVFLPSAPLAAGRRYDVQVSLRYGETSVQREWSFETGP